MNKCTLAIVDEVIFDTKIMTSVVLPKVYVQYIH